MRLVVAGKYFTNTGQASKAMAANPIVLEKIRAVMYDGNAEEQMPHVVPGTFNVRATGSNDPFYCFGSMQIDGATIDYETVYTPCFVRGGPKDEHVYGVAVRSLNSTQPDNVIEIASDVEIAEALGLKPGNAVIVLLGGSR